MFNGRNTRRVLGILFVVLLIFSFFILVPNLLKSSLIHVVEDNCKKCHLKIGSAAFNPLNGNFTFSNAHFEFIEKDSIEVTVEFESLIGEISFLDFLRGKTHLSSVLVRNPVVVLKDIYGFDPHPDTEANGKTFKFQIPSVNVVNGSFSYIYKDKVSEARLNMGDISGTMENFGNTNEYVDTFVTSRLEGRVEKSGHVILLVKSKVFERPVKVGVELLVKDKDLSDLTPFFKNYAGVSLKGNLDDGHAQVTYDDARLKSSVYATFRNFDVSFSKTAERTQTAAFFMNLGEAIMLAAKNTNKRSKDRIKSIELLRKKDESLVGSILRSMKEAALKVSSD